ncbi:MAG TPA: cryptochrome/photolyase family protein, partial [Myxococcota bacterium]|nr:cryptochrome/photolyase family protein [Myxococcota bacterium]
GLRMKHFRRALSERNPDPKGRKWLYVPYDQLGLLGPLAEREPSTLGIVMLEDPTKAARRPYHRQKLAYVLANGRHFALEQAARGVAVRFEVATEGVAGRLRRIAGELGPLWVMEPAERELHQSLAPLLAEGVLRRLPHPGWLTSAEEFAASCPRVPWKLDNFYRHVRARRGLLMDGGKPLGGKWSYDTENRQPWSGEPPAAVPPQFQPDVITVEVGELILRHYATHPGRLDLDQLPATLSDAERLWAWALSDCLPHFGPYEDAFSHRSRSLFHTRISPLLNLHRLLPARVLADVMAAELPLASKEGFVRQILGWREFVGHVHRATDGLRQLPAHPEVVAQVPLDAQGAAAPSFLGASLPLPPVFWGGAPSGLACLDDTLSAVWEEGYSHHITRLMVLSNLATLLGLDPRALTDWFWVAYVDAYDWVVEPNVLGMGTYAVGGLFTTKPYVSGSAYLQKMGDLCDRCAFQPGSTCPWTPMYWNFLARNADRLRRNPRVAGPVAAAERRGEEQRVRDAAVTEWVRAGLARGERLTPEEEK